VEEVDVELEEEEQVKMINNLMSAFQIIDIKD